MLILSLKQQNRNLIVYRSISVLADVKHHFCNLVSSLNRSKLKKITILHRYPVDEVIFLPFGERGGSS